jgi:ElaB/YqjD/DUF883 family membrane-anchored ribosome-binding protein
MESGGGDGGAQDVRAQAERAMEGVQDRVEELRGYAEDAGEWGRAFARERPVAAVAIAAGIGFLVGRLFARS